MYMHKITPPINFRYPEPVGGRFEEFETEISALGEDVFKWTARNDRWSYKSQAELDESVFDMQAGGTVSASWDDVSGLSLKFSDRYVFSSLPEKALGVCGQKWMMNFDYDPAMRFYGMGEKINGLEKTGVQTKFWNTDTWGDFGVIRVEKGVIDPLYVSIPYLLVVHDEGCLGILVDNPFVVSMILGAKEKVGFLQESAEQENFQFAIGSSDGIPAVYFICGKTVDDVTCKLQRLCGKAQRPPLWALGNHQSRFGYESLADLEELDQKFGQHEIPCDGLWLDIDYMERYKVFTCNPELFENCEERIKALQEKGRKVITILDPGVKREEGYDVYESGVEQDIFCKTPEGQIYTGYVWPGRTAFPDFSREEGRAWWATQVEEFTKLGFDGYWLDMNDPSTSSSELEEMRFNNGEDAHEVFHNQYALGMQRATLDGLLAQQPGRRPFLLSRSGSTGSSRVSALWTGDNFANEVHMKKSIEMSLNLALSGVTFNGPDVPGFGGEPTPELAELWYKQGFLFPFFRNHSSKGNSPREPWRFPKKTCEIMTHYMRLRYKLIPYLYNLFIEHEAVGRPVIRPVFYDVPDEFDAFCRIDDEFMIGPSILQAPFVGSEDSVRTVLLPQGDWFDACSGKWVCGGGDSPLEVSSESKSTPLYIRAGSVIPMLPGERKTQDKDLCDIELHLFVRPGESAYWEYEADDGETFDYRNGRRTMVSADISVEGDTLMIDVRTSENGYQPVRIAPVCYHAYRRVVVRQGAESTEISLKKNKWHMTGKALTISAGEAVEV